MKKEMNKKAQEVMGMSFGMIFSIFIIIVIIAVAFFAIKHFIGLSKCTNIGLFYEDLRGEVKRAWSATSGRYQSEVNLKIPKSGLFGTGIEYVCFGKLSDTASDESSAQMQSELEDKYDYDPQGDYNVFVYPPDNGCQANLGAVVLKCNDADCVNTKSGGSSNQFFCKAIEKDGTVRVWLYKESTDYQVSIRKQL